MNARILGSWLVWEENGKTFTLDTSDIITASFEPADSASAFGNDAYVTIWIYGHDVHYHMHGTDAEWFWWWWMKELREKEADAIIIRQREREWRETHAVPPEGPHNDQESRQT